MSRKHRQVKTLVALVSLLLALACIGTQVVVAVPQEIVLDTGEAIFSHRWQAGQPASPGGDGLGPVHNDISCVACHFQGGTGGAGGIEKNATLLSLGPRPAGMSKRIFHKTAAKIHPGLLEPSGDLKQTLVLHKFSTDVEYTMSRQRFVGLEMPVEVDEDERDSAERLVADNPLRSVSHASGVRMLLSQRNSPALFGLGLIDRIPDQQLHGIAERQKKRGLVSGRVSPVSGRVGKFGWKAQTATLSEFVRDACANELGLQVPGADQALHPMHLDYKPNGFDLNAGQLKSLTLFVSSLPQPTALTPSDESAAAIVQRGKLAFTKAGCAECHVETIGRSSTGVAGIFSDLLLHDMGPNLADPMLANPLTVKVKVRVPRSAGSGSRNSFLGQEGPSSPSAGRRGGGSYGGGSAELSSPGHIVSVGPVGTRTITTTRIVPTNRGQEWRTPPLWGVSQSAPYLHDGRASTLTEAILYHGGEAKFSVKRYLTLEPADRIAVVEFLNTLVPPGYDEI